MKLCKCSQFLEGYCLYINELRHIVDNAYFKSNCNNLMRINNAHCSLSNAFTLHFYSFPIAKILFLTKPLDLYCLNRVSCKEKLVKCM